MALDPIASLIGPTVSQAQEKVWFTNLRAWLARLGGDTLAAPAAVGKAIYGLTYANGTDAVNDLNINAGGAMDATGLYFMNLPTALGKQSDVAWSVGGTTAAPVGGVDTGAPLGNVDAYTWLIARSDTGVVDVIYSLSSTAPTMPANYDFKRLIGWFKRVGGTIVAFHTYETDGGGLYLKWDAPTLDLSTAALTTSRRTDAMKVPLNFSVEAELTVLLQDAAVDVGARVCCPDETDAAPGFSAAPLININSNASNVHAPATRWVRTSSTGTVASRSNGSVDDFRITTDGFRWGRR